MLYDDKIDIIALCEASRGHIINIRNYPNPVDSSKDWSNNPQVLLFGWWKHPRTNNTLLCGLNLKKMTHNEIELMRKELPNIMGNPDAKSRYWAARTKLQNLIPGLFHDYHKPSPYRPDGGAYATWRADRVGSITRNLMYYHKPYKAPQLMPPSPPTPSKGKVTKPKGPTPPKPPTATIPPVAPSPLIPSVQPQLGGVPMGTPDDMMPMTTSEIIPPIVSTTTPPVTQPTSPAGSGAPTPAGARTAPPPTPRRAPQPVQTTTTPDVPPPMPPPPPTSGQRRQEAQAPIKGKRSQLANRLKKRYEQ